ncbi:L-lactate dehydrogenase complex protein LldE [bacterium A37T11]|nr:L-lactate dehydrogenase complex protein LldE [bacterium A37T11]
MTAELFIPCFMDQMYPETAFNTIRILEKAGCNVLYNEAQTCCGQPPYNAGFWDEAKAIGSKFLADFSEEHYIVSPSAACTGMVKYSYSNLFTNTAVHNRCRNIQSHIFELSDFLVNILKKDYFGAELEGRAVYHDSCSALRECHIHNEPRQLLANVEGLDLVEMPDSDVCCGFGGNLSVKFSAISSAMAEQKIQNAMDVDAEYLISADASCLFHLQAYIEKHKLPLKTMHLADVLAHGWANI